MVKEPLGTKGARLTSHVSMPGRFLVFMPTVDHVRLSRRSSRGRASAAARHRESFREAHGFIGGVIIRTAASGRSEEDIVADLAWFHQIWTEIRQKMEARRAPAVLFQEQSLVVKLLRDLLTDDYSAIRIDDEPEHRRVIALVERIMPALLPRVKLYTKTFRSSTRRRPGRDDKRCEQGGSSRRLPYQPTKRWSRSTEPGRYVGKPPAGSRTPSSRPTSGVKEIVRQIRLPIGEASSSST